MMKAEDVIRLKIDQLRSEIGAGTKKTENPFDDFFGTMAEEIRAAMIGSLKWVLEEEQ